MIDNLQIGNTDINYQLGGINHEEINRQINLYQMTIDNILQSGEYDQSKIEDLTKKILNLKKELEQPNNSNSRNELIKEQKEINNLLHKLLTHLNKNKDNPKILIPSNAERSYSYTSSRGGKIFNNMMNRFSNNNILNTEKLALTKFKTVGFNLNDKLICSNIYNQSNNEREVDRVFFGKNNKLMVKLKNTTIENKHEINNRREEINEISNLKLKPITIQYPLVNKYNGSTNYYILVDNKIDADKLLEEIDLKIGKNL
jgi:hypothetical protein